MNANTLRILTAGLVCLMFAAASCTEEQKKDAEKSADSMASQMKDGLNKAAEAAKNNASNVVESAKDQASNLNETVKDNMDNAKAKAAEMFGANKDAFMQNFSSQLGSLDKLIADLKTKAANAGMLDKVKLEGVTKMLEGQRSGLDSQIDAVKNSDEGTFAKLSAQLTEALNAVMKLAQDNTK